MSVNKDKVTRGMSNRGQFCMVPNELSTFKIHEDAPVSAVSERIWLYLFSQSETWEPGQRKIAEDLRVCTSQIKKGLDALQQANMLKIIKPDRKGLRDLYELQIPEEWTGVKSTGVKITEEEMQDIVSSVEKEFDAKVQNGTVNQGLTGCQPGVDGRCPSEVDTYKTKQDELQNGLNECSKENLDYLRSDLINKWSTMLDTDNYDSRYGSFLIILGNLKDQGELNRNDLVIYEYQIKDSWCSQNPGSLKSTQRKKYQTKKKLTDQDFNLAVSEVYSSVDLEDVELKEINTPSVVKVEEYIPPSPDKILTLEKLSEIGEDTIGPMEDRLDHEFLELCGSVGEKSE